MEIKSIILLIISVFFLACEKEKPDPGQSNCTDCPVVDGLIPNAGIPGQTIKIYGKRLIGTTKVLFDNVEATIVKNTDTLEVLVPNKGQKDTVEISLRTQVGLNILSNNVKPKFTYLNSVASDFTPDRQRHSGNIEISGFFDVNQIDKVFINNQRAAIEEITESTLKIIVPLGCGSGLIKINLKNGKILNLQKRFIYQYQSIKTEEQVLNSDLYNTYMNINSKGQLIYAGQVSQGSSNKKVLVLDTENRNTDNSLKTIYDIPINGTMAENNYNFNHVTSIGEKFYLLTYELSLGSFSIRALNNGALTKLISYLPSSDYFPFTICGHENSIYIGSARFTTELPNTTLSALNLLENKIEIINPNISPLYLAASKSNILYYINTSPGTNSSSSLQSYNIISKEVKTNLAPP